MTAELTKDQRDILRAPDCRMDAYYYGFDRTGAPAIDAILSAVAYAGKAFHGTDQWYDTDVNYGPITGGMSATDVIQAAANEAAAVPHTLVVATADGTNRTGAENTVAGLLEVINRYLADGYSADELVIEGVTQVTEPAALTTSDLGSAGGEL